MEKKNKRNKKYRSIGEFEREFLPNSFKSKIEDVQVKKPGAFGSELAMEFLENIKRQLSKK